MEPCSDNTLQIHYSLVVATSTKQVPRYMISIGTPPYILAVMYLIVHESSDKHYSFDVHGHCVAHVYINTH